MEAEAEAELPYGAPVGDPDGPTDPPGVREILDSLDRRLDGLGEPPLPALDRERLAEALLHGNGRREYDRFLSHAPEGGPLFRNDLIDRLRGGLFAPHDDRPET